MSSRKVVSSKLQKFFVYGLFVIFLGALLASSGRAQAEASLGGFVSDASGAGIAGADVKITNLETGAERSLVTERAANTRTLTGKTRHGQPVMLFSPAVKPGLVAESILETK